MGAQDRPQCHFDIEINREPGFLRITLAGCVALAILGFTL